MITSADIVREILEHGSGVIRISPGPIEVSVGKHDAEAMRLLAALPDEITLGDAIATFQAAIWWMTFLAAMPKADPATDHGNTGAGPTMPRQAT